MLQRRRRKAFVPEPLMARKRTAGIFTSAVPTPGIIAAKIATLPQSAGLGTPKIKNPRPVIIP